MYTQITQEEVGKGDKIRILTTLAEDTSLLITHRGTTMFIYHYSFHSRNIICGFVAEFSKGSQFGEASSIREELIRERSGIRTSCRSSHGSNCKYRRSSRTDHGPSSHDQPRYHNPSAHRLRKGTRLEKKTYKNL